MWVYDSNTNELYHYGRKGMKWGQRIFGRNKSSDDHADYKKAHDKKSVRSMSDAELRSRNNRLQMERQYKQMTEKKGIGKRVVTGLIATAGTITAARGAYTVYKDIGVKALEVVGKWYVK